MSEAIAVINTIAAPDKLKALSLLLLSRTERLNVVPEAVYVPVPISNAEDPSSMQYRTELPLETPAAAKV
jgi:hypothetical protein|tara:strand:- start:526 stop:735 length:210 start_codon:yes stop_codon:yes gene_type:complete